MPTTILMLGISLVSGRLVKRFSASAVVALGGLCTAIALVFVALFHNEQVISISARRSSDSASA